MQFVSLTSLGKARFWESQRIWFPTLARFPVNVQWVNVALHFTLCP
jgi:hypothetical protein